MEHTLKLSSFLSMGACDGPGLRTVLFLYGCPLRCRYCHNPETWSGEGFTTETVAHLLGKIRRNKPYFNQGGGVTVSGGEPLLQQKSLVPLFQALKEEGIHRCIDTSACVEILPELLDLTDLFLLDVKFLSGEAYKTYTGLDIFDSVVGFLQRCTEERKPVWIRHVLYPGVTDNRAYVDSLLKFCQEYDQIVRVDLLPFKNICTTKYETMGMEFPMADTKLTSHEVVAELKAMVTEVYPQE